MSPPDARARRGPRRWRRGHSRRWCQGGAGDRRPPRFFPRLCGLCSGCFPARRRGARGRVRRGGKGGGRARGAAAARADGAGAGGARQRTAHVSRPAGWAVSLRARGCLALWKRRRAARRPRAACRASCRRPRQRCLCAAAVSFIRQRQRRGRTAAAASRRGRPHGPARRRSERLALGGPRGLRHGPWPARDVALCDRRRAATHPRWLPGTRRHPHGRRLGGAAWDGPLVRGRPRLRLVRSARAPQAHLHHRGGRTRALCAGTLARRRAHKRGLGRAAAAAAAPFRGGGHARAAPA